MIFVIKERGNGARRDLASVCASKLKDGFHNLYLTITQVLESGQRDKNMQFEEFVQWGPHRAATYAPVAEVAVLCKDRGEGNLEPRHIIFCSLLHRNHCLHTGPSQHWAT